MTHRLAVCLLLALLVVAACSDEPGGPVAPPNHAPTITSLTAASAVVPVGGATTLSAVATDADGDALVYTWSAFAGFFPDGVVGATVTWSPPARMGAYTLTLHVSDGKAAAVDSLTVEATVPEVAIAPTVLDFGLDGTALPVVVSNAGDGVLAWSAGADRDWIDVDPAAGSLDAGADATLVVTVDRAGLDTGVHTGTVTVVTPYGTAVVAVSLEMPPQPLLVVSGTVHDFGETGAHWSFDVSNGGGGAIAWSLGDRPVGVTAAPTSGEVADGAETVEVDLDRGPYPPGPHSVSLAVNSDAGVETVSLSFVAPANTTPTNLFFLHHSTGRNLIAEGNVRARLAAIDPNLELWDHDYNAIGLMNPDGVLIGTSYGIPGDDTDPVGLHELWTTDNAARARILADHGVIAFKSCYTASEITSDAQLAQYRSWYLEIRDVLDAHPDKIFLLVSPPPRHRLATDPDDAARARAFADWMGGAEFLSGHANLLFFDLFDQLANDDDVLRYDYERSHTGTDSHPNATANAAVGPRFAAALAAAAGSTRR